MADEQKFGYEVEIDGHGYSIESPVELSDEQAYAAVKEAHDRRSSDPRDGILPGIGAGIVDTALTPISVGKALFEEGRNPSALGKATRTFMPMVEPVVPFIEPAMNAVGAGIKHLWNRGPVQTAKDLYEGYAQDPEAAVKSATEFATQALLTPPAMKGALRYGPAAVNPVLRGAGKVMEKTGKAGNWALRGAGAAQIGMGSVPSGVATMAAPEILQGAGDKLIRMGTPTGKALQTVEARILKANMDLNRIAAGDTASLDLVGNNINKIQSELADNFSVSKRSADVEALSKHQSSVNELLNRMRKLRKQWDASEANKARLSAAEAEKVNLKPGPKSVTETRSAVDAEGRRVTERQRYNETGAEPGQTLSDAEKLAKVTKTSVEQAQKILDSQNMPKAARSDAVLPKSAKSSRSLDLEEINHQMNNMTPFEKKVIDGTSTNVDPAEMERVRKFEEARKPMTPEEIKDKVGKIFDKDRKIDVSNVPASKTSREMSKTPGLSRNDVLSVGMNPDMPIKKLTWEAADHIYQTRLKRHTMDYREAAALQQRLKELVEQDQ